MTDRRSGPPLFDLMRERGDRPQAPKPQQPTPPKQGQSGPSTAKPAQNPTTGQATGQTQAPTQPKPQTSTARSDTRQTAWDSSGGVSRAERSAAAMLDDDVQTDTGIVLSTPKFYTIIAIALLLIVGAWAGGYQIGYGDGKDEMSQFVRDQPVVSPQGGSNSEATQRVVEPPASNQQPQTNTQPSTQAPTQTITAPTRGSGAVMTAAGFRSDDPRAEGMNYLVLATLPTEQAADAISFMNTNGVTIIGVPELDSRGSGANNPSRYTLYSLGLAIPGNRWSAMSSQRIDHQSMIATLGARWQRERRGGSDFSQTNWEKYEP